MGTGLSDKAFIIERAFQLARQGHCPSVDAIKATLVREGYEGVSKQMPPELRKQLRAIISGMDQQREER
jgi:hypothetical protein